MNQEATTQTAPATDTGGSWRESVVARLCSLVEAEGAANPARADQLAWAAFALAGVPGRRQAATTAASRLAKLQQRDGRVIVQEGLAESWWPTSPAVLAWTATGGHQDRIVAASSFLLGSSGLPIPREDAAAEGHDTTIPGWSWIEGTHSWVDPTAMAMLALRASGHGDHARVADGRRLLLDRQLPSGGWNMGNTVVFGSELRPAAESTGLALTALAGLVDEAAIARSLEAVVRDFQDAITPLTFCWAAFAAKAWGRETGDLDARVGSCLALESTIGAYDPALLGLLMVVSNTGADLFGAMGIAGRRSGREHHES